MARHVRDEDLVEHLCKNKRIFLRPAWVCSSVNKRGVWASSISMVGEVTLLQMESRGSIQLKCAVCHRATGLHVYLENSKDASLIHDSRGRGGNSTANGVKILQIKCNGCEKGVGLHGPE